MSDLQTPSVSADLVGTLTYKGKPFTPGTGLWANVSELLLAKIQSAEAGQSEAISRLYSEILEVFEVHGMDMRTQEEINAGTPEQTEVHFIGEPLLGGRPRGEDLYRTYFTIPADRSWANALVRAPDAEEKENKGLIASAQAIFIKLTNVLK
jgi:hypothetical protein